MNPARRRTARELAAVATFALVAGVSRGVRAQSQRTRLDYEYRLINPQPVATGDRIEVIEFFWYGCPYCNALQPSLENWARRKPADVALRHVPAVLRRSWVPHARLFYTLEALGELDRLHQDVYRTYHVEKDSLDSEDSTAGWAARRGIDRAAWIATYNSPDTERKVDYAIAATRAYMIEGTPSLVVDGRFITSTGMSETIAGVIQILEDLIVMARERRAAK